VAFIAPAGEDFLVTQLARLPRWRRFLGKPSGRAERQSVPIQSRDKSM